MTYSLELKQFMPLDFQNDQNNQQKPNEIWKML